MVRIIWSPYAVDDLEAICDNITKDSQHYARLFAQGVINAIESLEIFPESGRIVPEYNQKSIREIIFQSYRIIYQTKPDDIEILAIMHGMRLIGN
jgi:plasmid stabilization system protein ParE